MMIALGFGCHQLREVLRLMVGISSVMQQSKIDLITILPSVDVPGSVVQNFFNVKC